MKCPLSQAEDWIAIGDCSIGIGMHKVIMILGIRSSDYRELVSQERLPSLSDVVPLHMSVVETCSGDAICHAFQQAEARVGKISQICIDGGAEMQSGSRRYKSEALKDDSERTIHITYDTPHKTGCLLKRRLDNDPRWQSFLARLNTLKSKIQQTALAHLTPPNQRSKCRYMNIDEIVSWSQKILMLLDMQKGLQNGSCGLLQMKKAPRTSNSFFASTLLDKGSTNCALEAYSGNDMVDLNEEEYNALLENFGWLNGYRKDISLFSMYALIGATARDEVRRHGLHSRSYQKLSERFDALPLDANHEAYNFCGEFLDFIESETQGLKDGEILLGSDEIVESLFGLMKSILYEDGKHGLTAYVLAAAAACGPLNEELVDQAFESVKDEDVEKWSKENLNRTYLSKRRCNFKVARVTMRHAEKMKGIFKQSIEQGAARAEKVKNFCITVGRKLTGTLWGLLERLAI